MNETRVIVFLAMVELAKQKNAEDDNALVSRELLFVHIDAKRKKKEKRQIDCFAVVGVGSLNCCFFLLQFAPAYINPAHACC